MFLYVRVCVWKSVLGLPHKWIFIACYVRRWQKRLVFDGFYDHFFSSFFSQFMSSLKDLAIRRMKKLCLN